MHFSTSGMVALFLALIIFSSVNGQGTFLPAEKVVESVFNPIGLFAGLNPTRNSFKEVLKRGNVTKWVQTVSGVPVYGSVLTTHNDEAGKIAERQGVVSFTADLTDTQPRITSGDALSKLRTQYNHLASNSKLTFRFDDPELRILQGENGRDKLVWKIGYNVDWENFRRKEEGKLVPAYIIGFVNAQTGTVERSWNNLQNATINAITGNAKIGKKFVNLDVQKNGGTCRHRDDERRIEVFDIWNRRQISRFTTSLFTCNRADDENWDLFSRTGGYSPRNEAFKYAQQFVDLWVEVMGTETMPHLTSTSYLRFYVHYDHSYENAFFDGDSFKFGDGRRIFYPLTSLDIVCHEIGHAVTQWHGGNMEYGRQSGAMNEAYSDILGETCDMHYNNRTDGLIGTDIMRPGNFLGTSMRDMCNPTRLGSIDHMNDYHDGLDVHYSSGIYNKAWCTLWNMKGWDYIRAFEVFTDANLLYWSADTTMHCGACGVESAAADRGYDERDVASAFQKVGVSCRSCSR